MNGFPLGRYFGIDVYVHWTFAILVLLLGYDGYAHPGAGQTALQGAGEQILMLLAVFFCVTLHEFGHALTARQYGIRTLDIVLWPLGGIARLQGMKWTPTSELLIAIAGPMVNVVIACVLIIIELVRYGLAGFPEIDLDTDTSFMTKLIVINIVLVIFNMIPAFPMDGGRVLRALMGYFTSHLTATTVAVRVGQVVAVLFAIGGVMSQDFFLILIGIFVFTSAQAELKMVQMMSFAEMPMRRNGPRRRRENVSNGADPYYTPPTTPGAGLPPTQPRQVDEDPRKDLFSGRRGL